MSAPFELIIDVSEPYNFNKQSLASLQQNQWIKNQWPLVYFIQNQRTFEAYVGESTNGYSRIVSHLANPDKAFAFNQISIIGCDKFNKSATLDIESNLIRYIAAEGTYKLHNGNSGLVNHKYYQQDLYKGLFKEIWSKLIERKFVSKSLREVENSELFKYSPYKSLTEDQYTSVLEILEGLTKDHDQTIFVTGGAGTGKTVVATYLIKLLATNILGMEVSEFNDEELREVTFIQLFQKKYPNAKIGLVVAMSSLRESLRNVFRQVPGLNASMVMSPSDTFKSKEKYDLLIVDEAHRLRQYKNISWMGAFRKNNQKLQLGDDGNELDWIMANSKNQIFFYDQAQSVKPSDIPGMRFSNLLHQKETLKLTLHSQMRVQGGTDYIRYIDELLNSGLQSVTGYQSDNYELLYFDSLTTLYQELTKKERAFGLCRLVAGFSWPYLSKNDKAAIDIKIEDLCFQWNQTEADWVNSPNAFREIGCIHTTQGYDLNYTGVIFGNEIDYNPQTGQIEINAKQYFDTNGKKGIADPDELKAYIINIYKTILYRGIRGSFVYACQPNLATYLKQNLTSFNTE